MRALRSRGGPCRARAAGRCSDPPQPPPTSPYHPSPGSGSALGRGEGERNLGGAGRGEPYFTRDGIRALFVLKVTPPLSPEEMRDRQRSRPPPCPGVPALSPAGGGRFRPGIAAAGPGAERTLGDQLRRDGWEDEEPGRVELQSPDPPPLLRRGLSP